jgi:adiponectin receptor
MDKTKATASDAVEKVTVTTKEVEKTIEKKLTYLWDEIDTWQQDNHYIISGYRPASNSYLTSFRSIFHLHNETVNIYTHLSGSVLFLVLSLTLYQVLGNRYPYATKEDVYALSCFFLGAIACLGMSATYHTISNHSHAVAVWGNQLDYAGIVALIWGSFVPVLYYTFRARQDLQQRYWAMVCFNFAMEHVCCMWCCEANGKSRLLLWRRARR